MNKNLLDDLCICNLYQVDDDRCFIEKGELHGRYSLFSNMDIEMPSCIKVGSILVKKSKLFKYNLREVLTGVSIDTIYENYNGMHFNDWRNYTVKGNKKEYNTFALVPSTRSNVTLDQINKYCEEHPNVEEYKNNLIKLINKGNENQLKKKQNEKECLELINSEVYEKVFKRKK